MSRRPLGVTISALALGWLALTGVGNAGTRFSSEPVLAILAMIYAVTAGAACVGLWRSRPFGLLAFRAWALSLLLMLLWLGFTWGVPILRVATFSFLQRSSCSSGTTTSLEHPSPPANKTLELPGTHRVIHRQLGS